MRALFVTTLTSDCGNHVRAWESAFGPAEHFTFNPRGINNDWQIVETAERLRPDVIFYIGADKGPGNPRRSAFTALRAVAPSVLICSDSGDTPWHPILAGYRTRQCFDLMVGIDGAKNAPVDLATLTPVDHRPYENGCARYIRCGFSGTIGRWNARSEIVRPLVWVSGLMVRDRLEGGSYDDHAQFLKRCRMVLNISHTGSGLSHHVKGRVVEAGFAGAALLEHKGSPIADWFPAECYLSYRDTKEASEIIAGADDPAVGRSALALSEHVRAHYTAAQIYGRILEQIKVVDRPKPVAAA